MIRLTKETVKGIIGASYPIFNAFKKVREVPVWGDLYQNTFNQQETNVDSIVEILKKTGKGNKKVLEVLSGNAYESYLIKQQLPNNDYYGADIDTGYFKKLKGIRYLKEDCTIPRRGCDVFDFIFVANSNVSLCMFSKEEQMIKHASYVRSRLKKGGLYYPSFYESTEEEKKITVDYQTLKIISDKYKGKYAHWFLLNVADLDGFQMLYNYVFITKDSELKKDSVIIDAMYHQDDFITRGWDRRTIIYFFEQQGFEKKCTEKDILYFKKL